MPNPNRTEEHECQRCHDTGEIPGTYRLCPHCTGAPVEAVAGLTRCVCGGVLTNANALSQVTGRTYWTHLDRDDWERAPHQPQPARLGGAA